jgi:hypothetical protein
MATLEEDAARTMPQTLIVTTIIREAPPDQPSGSVYTIDLDHLRVTGRTPIIEAPLRQFDPNPRGGLRGGRGITIIGDSLCIANSIAIFRFDKDWRLLQSFSHPAGADLHDILFHNGHVWAMSSRNDLALAFDLNGRLKRLLNLHSFWRTTQKQTQTRPTRLTDHAMASGKLDFRDPRTHTKRHYDHLHANSLAFCPDGSLLFLFGMITSLSSKLLSELLLDLKTSLQKYGWWKPIVWLNQLLIRWFHLHPPKQTELATGLAKGKAAILKLRPDGQPTIPFMDHSTIAPIHSLQFQSDGTVLFNDTNAQEITQLHLASGTKLARIEVPKGFLRGLIQTEGNLLIAGNQNYLQFADLKKQQLLDQFKISDNPRESVYDIKPLPSTFQPLPDQLPTP